jgi:hypothetical protein
LLHVYAAIQSQSMNADGISYLDIGDAYFRADWANAVNAVWSPLYSWILGLATYIINPAPHWEFPTVHAINFLIYLGALGSFEFMWRSVRLFSRRLTENGALQLPEWLWWTLGYLLFIWVTLSLIQIWSVTPDMLMAALVFVAGGLLVQIRSGAEDSRLFLGLGLVLGLGYLSKTFMFPVALVFLALAWLIQNKSRKSWERTMTAFGAFVCISLPFILLISQKEGKLTIGEAGTVTYLRYANGVPFPHWQGDPLQGIIPLHPSRIIHEAPPIYEFGGPVAGTYPISTDPSYWYAGIEPRIDFESLLGRLLASGLVYMDLFFHRQGILLACVLAFYAVGPMQKAPMAEDLRRWGLVLPAVIAFGLYATVLVEDRYVGAFILLFWTDILGNVRLPDTANNRLWLRSLGMIASIGLLANVVLFNLDGFSRLTPVLGASTTVESAPPPGPLAVAQTLKELGVMPGDRVGVIGYAYDSFWARLARVRIVAEMLKADADEFWRGDETLRQSVLHFRGSATSW